MTDKGRSVITEGLQAMSMQQLTECLPKITRRKDFVTII